MENYRVLAGYILIEPDRVKEKTESGIFIPETAASMKQQRGKVVIAGESTDKEVVQVSVGDTVVFPKGMGINVTIDKKDYLLMRQRDILLYIPKS